MEFYEKLQQLRKSRKMTQEELAEALYVSRTAISKWESGRGYPSIDSLKQISLYFSVSIDDLLSSEKLMLIAQKETHFQKQYLCGFLFAVVDLFSLLLIVLPLYPKTVENYVYSVNLWMYAETAFYNQMIYWVLFVAMLLCGFLQLLILYLKQKSSNKMKNLSLVLSTMTVLYLSICTEAYAATLAILMLLIKFLLLIQSKTV